jgi:UDP-glucose 4-epimerase
LSRHRVIVTGGCGFVGSRLVRKLIRDEVGEVMVVDDLSLGAPENLGPAQEKVSLVECDIRDQEAVADAFAEFEANVVIHTAAIHFIPACDRDPKRCVDVNVGGTQSVLDASLKTGVESVVLVSTGAVYAPASSAHPDDGLIGPGDIYGLSKLFSEQLGELFHARTEIPVRVARLFNVFGPGETNPHLIPAIISQAEKSDELKLGNLSTQRDYIFVDDVAQGLIDLATTPLQQGLITCNLGAERAVDGTQIVETVARLMGRELSVVSDPKRMRASDRPLLLSDCSLAHSILGWSARCSLEDGLRAAIAEPTAAGVLVE